MDKDLSNPRAMAMIAHAQSDSESLYRPASFYSADTNNNLNQGANKNVNPNQHHVRDGGGLTPTHEKTPSN